MASEVKHLTSLLDIEDSIEGIIDRAIELKKKGYDPDYQPMKGMSVGMIFEKPSTRTRVSFEVGASQLGAHPLYLGKGEIHLGKKETIADTARVLSRFVDMLVYRAYSNKDVRELRKWSSVPVINALDDMEHPCQTVADLQTVKEHKGRLKGLKMAYVGDGNNVANSLMLGCAMVGMDFTFVGPKGYEPNSWLYTKALAIAKRTGSTLTLTDNIDEGVKDADAIYTDVWVSMGQEDSERKIKDFIPYQVNNALLSHAKDDVIVLHCLPAYRGKEITDEVMDGEHSVVFDEAENRLHAQKAIMLHLLGMD